MQRFIGKFYGLLVCFLVLTGCANVAPTERGIHARTEMQFDPDSAHVKVTDQIYAAREAAAGGRVTGGGGCGCTM